MWFPTVIDFSKTLSFVFFFIILEVYIDSDCEKKWFWTELNVHTMGRLSGIVALAGSHG